MWIVSYDPFLTKKWLKSKARRSVNSARVHCSWENSQKLRLLFMNSNNHNSAWISWNMCPKKKKVKRKCQFRISVSKPTHSMKSIQFFFFFSFFFFEKKVRGNQSIAFKQILETFIPLFGHSNWISYFIRYGLLR